MLFTCICKKCLKKFESKRSTAKYCSTKCKRAYFRAKDEKAQKVLNKFKEHISQKNPEREKGYPLNDEEKQLIKDGLLDENALLTAPRVTRDKWVKSARVYKPTYISMGNYTGATSRYKPYDRTFGAGTGK